VKVRVRERVRERVRVRVRVWVRVREHLVQIPGVRDDFAASFYFGTPRDSPFHPYTYT
jgi:hypothetical protein